PGILTYDKNCFGKIKIFQVDCALAHANRFVQCSSTRLVTHVRAVRQVVGAKLSDEQLIKKGRFVAGAAGCIKDGLIGMIGGVKLSSNQRKGLVPTNLLVVRSVLTQDH